MKECINSREALGWIIMVLAFVFGFIQTWYFGWNTFPKSEGELLADLVCMGLFCHGLGILKSAYNLKRFISDEYEDEDL